MRIAAYLKTGLLICMCITVAKSQTAFKVEPLNRFPRMVHTQLLGKVSAFEQEVKKTQSLVTTREEALEYVSDVKEKIRKSFGAFPQKTALNARVTGIIERDTHVIEKIIFESRPGFLVTGNLYIPKNVTFPRPAVLALVGHVKPGKAYKMYQAFCLGLVKKGYVVFIHDPIGFGERKQEDVAINTHIYYGSQQLLVGENQQVWQTWDAIRALYYLVTRKEVDPSMIGCTGNSGGGYITSYLCALDDRITMAAPSCWLSTFRRCLEDEHAHCIENYPAGLYASQFTQGDFLAAFAPKPVVLITKENDFLDVRGAEEAYEFLNKLYALLGKEENVKLVTNPGNHGFAQDGRETMYSWFNRFTGNDRDNIEPQLELEDEQTLWCTENGNVMSSGSKTIFSFTRKKSQHLKFTRENNMSAVSLKKLAVRLLAIDSMDYHTVPDHLAIKNEAWFKSAKSALGNGVRFSTYAVETEPGIHAVVYRIGDKAYFPRPSKSLGKVLLYISHQSAIQEIVADTVVAEIIKSASPDEAFYTCDVRGIGESSPRTISSATDPANHFQGKKDAGFLHAMHYYMFGEPFVGRQTHDILQVINWLDSFGRTDIHIVANGWGSIPAAFASLLHDNVKEVTLVNALTSYSDIAESTNYTWHPYSFVPGILNYFDMPDVYKKLENKKIKIIEPRGASFLESLK